jgi:fructose-1,6-bisphosphatase II
VECDLAASPVEGAYLVGRGLPGAISLLVAVEPDALPRLPAVRHMEVIVTGEPAHGALDLDDAPEDNLDRIAFGRNVRIPDLAVAVVNHERNQDLVDRMRKAGARLVLLKDGEIAGALLAAVDGTSIDAMVGIVGQNDTVISACVARALGGELQARRWPLTDSEREAAADQLGRIFTISDLSPESVEAAVTGVTDSELLRAVRYGGQAAVTESLSMSTRTRTVRWVRSVHRAVRGGQEGWTWFLTRGV